MIVSGVSGNATFDQQKRFPFMFNGHSLKLDYTKTFYELKLQQTSGGTISGSPVSGESGTTFDLSATPDLHYHLETYSANGTSLTGSSGTYTNSDVTAKGIFAEDPRYGLTIQQSTGGTLVGSPTSGYSGDLFGLTATPGSHYSFNSYSVTGTTLTGNSGMFNGANVTAKANWTEDPKYTLTVQQSTGGTLTANKTSGYQNDTFTLTPTPATKYTFSAYQTTGTTMTGNNGKFNTSNVTAKAVWEYHPSTVTAYVNKPKAGERRYITTFGIYDKQTSSKSAASAFAYKLTSRGWGFEPARACYSFSGYQKLQKSTHDNSQVITVNMFPCLASETTYANFSSYFISAGDYYVATAYTKLMNTLSSRFSNNRYMFSSTTADKWFAQPYGFSLNESAYIGNFSARIPVYAYTAHKLNQYRVNINGTVGQWKSRDITQATTYIDITAAKLTNPQIEIEFSADYTGNVSMSLGGTSAVVSAGWTACWPSWTGNMCYLE